MSMLSILVDTHLAIDEVSSVIDSNKVSYEQGQNMRSSQL